MTNKNVTWQEHQDGSRMYPLCSVVTLRAHLGAIEILCIESLAYACIMLHVPTI